ncbi:MAG: zinc-dependent alcohol dehydrogenase [Alphaproteobacteria bacterium]
MRALVYEGVEALSLRDLPDRVAVDGEVLVRVRSSGICGSDMHAYFGHDDRRPAPLILGHEASGVIESGPRAGQRVTVNPLVVDPNSPSSLDKRENLDPGREIISMPPRQGAFAELIAVPERNLVDVPDNVPFEKAALAEPLACGWHAVRLAFEKCNVIPAEASCLVLGGGAIGFGSALALQAFGAQKIKLVEPNKARRENLANHCNFELLSDGSQARESSFDVIIDGVGYPSTRAAACALVKPGGTIAHIGLGSAEGGIDVRRLTLQEITFFGTYTYTKSDFEATAEAIFNGSLGALDWPDLRPLDHGVQAFKDLKNGSVSAPKIILQI